MNGRNHGRDDQGRKEITDQTHNNITELVSRKREVSSKLYLYTKTETNNI